METIENDKPDILHELSSLQQKLSEFSTILDEMSIDDKRNALRKLVKTILWDGNTIHLYLTGSETSDSSSDIYDIPEPIEPDCKVHRIPVARYRFFPLRILLNRFFSSGIVSTEEPFSVPSGS